jgi:hypothetical protein
MPKDALELASLVASVIAMSTIIVLYTVEYRRESWCISELDICPDTPDNNLGNYHGTPQEHLAETIIEELQRKNRAYYRVAVVAMVLTVANLLISIVYLALQFGGMATATSLASFTILVMGKLWRSFSLARRGVDPETSMIARSAYLLEATSYNIIDRDKDGIEGNE